MNAAGSGRTVVAHGVVAWHAGEYMLIADHRECRWGVADAFAHDLHSATAATNGCHSGPAVWWSRALLSRGPEVTGTAMARIVRGLPIVTVAVA
jgi:hypothetical protein